MDIKKLLVGLSLLLCLSLIATSFTTYAEPTQDAFQDWTFGSLFSVDAPDDVLADLDFDPRRHYSTSCYQVWLDSIVDAVRKTTQT